MSDLVITGVVDGPLTGGRPKAIEIFVRNDIPDLSIYGVGSANDGDGSDGEEFTFPNTAATAGDYIYIAAESTSFATFFGFAPDYTTGILGALDIDGNDAIELFQNGDVIDVFGNPTVDGTDQVWEYTNGWASRNVPPIASTNFAPEDWTFSGKHALNEEVTNTNADTPVPFMECFLAGTHVLTECGEKRVEELEIGDLVQTAEGHLEAIKWVGRQTCHPKQVQNPLRSHPILVKAGALDHHLPHRDLYVSPDHALFVDGLLINAGALVNGVSIFKTDPTTSFTYYHIELDKHVLLVTEGTYTESYLPQHENRDCYDNGDEYDQLYPSGRKIILWPLDYPRISSYGSVPRYIRRQLMAIANRLYGSLTSKSA